MDNFNDPELKKALSRALPRVAAPASLRLSIERELEDLSSAPAADPLTHSNPWHISNWFPAHRRMAVAAAIAGLGLGIGLFLASDNVEHQHSTFVASSDPVIVQGALVRHDQMHQSLERDGDLFRQSLLTVPQVREQLHDEMPVPITQPDLVGWQFAGAQPCNMGTCCGAQLLYTRGHQTLSVFVFPPGRISPAMVAACKAGNHLTAVRPTRDATLLVVATCPAGELSQSDVEQVASQLVTGN